METKILEIYLQKKLLAKIGIMIDKKLLEDEIAFYTIDYTNTFFLKLTLMIVLYLI